MATKNLGQISAIHIGTVEPQNKNLVWRDIAQNPNLWKIWNSVDLVWEVVPSQTVANNFLNLGDTPVTYAGNGGKILKIKANLSGIEFVDEVTFLSEISAAIAKGTLVDADEFLLSDAGVVKKTLWSNIKATLKTYFDTLYVSVSTVTSQLITNWNTAFGWGNHADAGYLTSESDPVFTAHPANNVVDNGDGTEYLSNDGTYKAIAIPDGSKWEDESETLIRPKDGRKVNASHIEGLEQGGHIILDPVGNTMPTQDALQFGNGLSVTDNTIDGSTQIKLGGNITEDLYITSAGNNFVFIDSTYLGGVSGFGMLGATPVLGISDYIGLINMSSDGINSSLGVSRDLGNIQMSVIKTSGNASSIFLRNEYVNIQYIDGTGAAIIRLSDEGITVFDSISNAGIKYELDYSAGFTERSLVDKGYVDSAIIAGSGHVIKDSSGTNMPTQPALQFGAGFTVADESGKTVVGGGSFSESIPFVSGSMTFDKNKYIQQHQITATFEFTKSAGTHYAGAIIEACLIADGVTGHKPTFSADFNIQYDNWDNTNGAKNLVRMRYLPEGILTEIRKI